MKTEISKHFARLFLRLTTVIVVLLCVVIATSGCAAIGFLFHEGPFERGRTPDYDLEGQQERKLLVWIECPRSANTAMDVQEKLTSSFELYLTERAGFEIENVIFDPPIEKDAMMLDPKEVARSLGAGYLLLVHVDRYESDFLHIREFYAGELVTRSILFDVDLDAAVWPSQPTGKMTHITVDLEEDGRDAMVSRLTSATAHCIMRYLYPCKKLQFKTADERVSMQDAYEIETY